MVSEVIWSEDVLVISIVRNGIEKILKGRTVMMSRDLLILLLPENIVVEVQEKLMKHTLVD